MGQWEQATPDTLAEFCGVLAPHDLKARLESTHARLEAGTLAWSQLLMWRVVGHVGAAVRLTPLAIPLFPSVRADLDETEVLAFYRALFERVSDCTPSQRLVVQTNLAPHNPDWPVSVGWRADGHEAVYETDLTARPYPPDPAGRERPLADLLTPEVERFYAPIHALDPEVQGESPREVLIGHSERQDGQLVTLEVDGHLIGAATIAPAGPEHASIGVLGISPEWRGQGWGRRLHASALAVASRTYRQHTGSTAAMNLPMRRILEANGGRLMFEQFYYRV